MIQHLARVNWLYTLKTQIALLSLFGLPFLSAGACRGQVRSFSGRAEAAFSPKSKKTAPDEQRELLRRLEEGAIKGVLENALASVYGNKDRFKGKFDEVLAACVQSASQFIKESSVVAASVAGSQGAVEIVAKVDEAALKKFLLDRFEMSTTIDVEQSFKVYIAAYTVEGMDPDRSKPQLLREEIVDNQTNVQSSARSSDRKDVQAASASSASQSASSVAGSSQTSQSASVAASERASVSGSRSVSVSATELARSGLDSTRSSASASDSGSFRGSSQSSLAASSQTTQSMTIAATQKSASAEASASFRDQSAKESAASFSDTSREFRSLRVYADTTRKGAGQSNEVRNTVEALLKANGFLTVDARLNLSNREFPSEDSLNEAVVKEIQANAEVKPEQFVAVALNSYTPMPNGDFTSKISLRITRIGDGQSLLALQPAIGQSKNANTEDVARVESTQLAIARMQQDLTNTLKDSIRQFQRDSAAPKKAAEAFELKIAGVGNPFVVNPIKKALEDGGFKPKLSFSAGQVTLLVPLNGRELQSVSDIVGPHIGAYEVVSMTESRLLMKAK